MDPSHYDIRPYSLQNKLERLSKLDTFTLIYYS
jgi:hypothetical protein